jgi:hypothetical protein
MTDYRTIIVAGSRHGYQGGVYRGMDDARSLVHFDHVVVGSWKRYEGGGHAVDAAVFEWAVSRELDATVMPARWKTGDVIGRSEGPIRNRRMAARWPAFLSLFAFPGGTGTSDMMAVARGLGKAVYKWRGDAWEAET